MIVNGLSKIVMKKLILYELKKLKADTMFWQSVLMKLEKALMCAAKNVLKPYKAMNLLMT
jgi:hypothetical protein